VSSNLDAKARANFEDPREYPIDVSIDGWHLRAKGNRGHGACGVWAESGKLLECVDGAGKVPSEIVRHDTGGFVEISGSAVIAEALPVTKNVCSFRSCEGLHVGELPNEITPILSNTIDLGLLEHDLADPDSVGGRFGPPPREQPLRPRDPLQEETTN
jgi:hypothetical protein